MESKQLDKIVHAERPRWSRLVSAVAFGKNVERGTFCGKGFMRYRPSSGHRRGCRNDVCRTRCRFLNIQLLHPLDKGGIFLMYPLQIFGVGCEALRLWGRFRRFRRSRRRRSVRCPNGPCQSRQASAHPLSILVTKNHARRASPPLLLCTSRYPHSICYVRVFEAP